MPLARTYSVVDTEAAIDRGNRKNINKLKLVRNDVTNRQFNQTKIRPAQRNQSIPPDFQYPGARDVGHVFRHVWGTHASGKSIYKDKRTAVLATQMMLNSQKGQDILKAMSKELAGKALYDNRTMRLCVDVSKGNFLGSDDEGLTWKKIELAKCELMSLGDNLWVHSSYPSRYY